MKNLFDSEEKRNEAISSFTSLLTHPGWLLVQKIIEANIEVVRHRLEVGGDKDESKFDVDRLRDKLKFYREVLNSPKTMLESLQKTGSVEMEFDPFYTEESLKKSREVKKE